MKFVLKKIYIDIYEFILLNIFMEEPSNLSEWKNEQILRILCWVKDALFGTLSYVWWKFVRSSTKSFENAPMMWDVAEFIKKEEWEKVQRARTQLRICEHWKNPWGDSGDIERYEKEIKNYVEQPENSYYISGAIERYEKEIKNAKAKISKALQEIMVWVRGELEILKGLLINKGEGQQDASD